MNLTTNDPGRNRPSEEGSDNDPNLRDDSAQQPGISTVSGSDTDYENDDLTETVADNDEGDFDDDDADLDFDEVDEDDDSDDE